MDKLGKLCSERSSKNLRMKKVDIIANVCAMSAMNAHYIYITYFGVTEIEVVTYL